MLTNRILGCLWGAIFTITSLPIPVLAKDSSKSSTHKKHEYDYIIVGNGTAGAVLARKLSDNCKHSVLVLEAGENYSHNPEILKPFSLENFNVLFNNLAVNPKYNFMHTQYLQDSVDGSSNFMSTGRMWGGSSAHNYQVTFRGSPEIWDSWAALSGNPRWSYNNVLSTMKAVETYTPDDTIANPLQRGSNGPIYITQTPPVDNDPFAQVLSTVVNAPFIPDLNDPTYGNIGTSAVQLSITPGANSIRSFSINGYLPDSVVTPEGKGRKGRKLQILSRATVSRVLFKGKKAKGVEFILSGTCEKVKKAYAKKKVILCAGALSTPAILQRSGIGDAALLESLDIPVLVNNSNVGANLSNQYGGSLVAVGPVVPEAFFAEVAAANGSPYYPDDNIRRLDILGYSPFPGGALIAGIILQPKSLGSVNIVSKDPITFPLLLANLFSDGPVTMPGTDAYSAVSGLKLAKAVADEAGDFIIQPTPDVFEGGDEAILQYIVSNPNVLNHWSGTTRMASCPANGVVDGNLHVFGVKNLMVVDLGVAPSSSDGNPSFPVYVIANEAAHILGAW